MALYVVVHHQRDKSKPWPNTWDDDCRLRTITTTVGIGRRCKESAAKQERVFVHRCAWGGNRPQIVCSVEVARVDTIDRLKCLVTFQNAEMLAAPPPVSPGPGENFYVADPVKSG